MKILNSQNRHNFIQVTVHLFLTLLILLMIFGRSFTGLYFLNFRIGEWLTAFSLIVSILLIFIRLTSYYKEINYKNIYNINLLIILTFVFELIFHQVSNPTTYLIKSSSYIWLVTFFYIGYFIFQKINYENYFIKYLVYLLPVIFIFQTTYYPKLFSSFFINNSDKFEYLKAGDVLLVFLSIILITQNNLKNNSIFVIFFLLSVSLFAPYFLYASKGSFLALVVIILFQIKSIFRYVNLKKINSIWIFLISIILFFSSAYYIYGNFVFEKEKENQKIVVENIVSGVASIVNERNTSEIFASFYFVNGRLYSEDATANWRLQIWQDIFEDLNEKELYFFGYGYEDIIPAMDDVERKGTDGTNEHVHNYFVNITARGGLMQFILFIAFHFAFIKNYYKEYNSLKILKFIIPVFIVAFFDTSMESVRFPIIYYSLLGYFYNEDSIYIR